MNHAAGKVLVTGSSGSLGSSICLAFRRDGYSVVGLDVASPSADLDVEAANAGSWAFLPCDLANVEAVNQALLSAHAEGPFDVVVNNAGIIYSAPLLTIQSGKFSTHDFEAWNRVLASTLSSAFYVSAHCAQRMVAAGKRGTIVNISSICAAGNVGQAAYSAAKAGVNAMTASLSKELGPMGIRVAAIAPGFFDTESTRRALSKDALSRIRKAIPLQKLGEPGQLYHAIRFIVDNGYFHGKVLELDGGLVI